MPFRTTSAAAAFAALAACAPLPPAESDSASIAASEAGRFAHLFGPIADIRSFVASRGNDVWAGYADAPFGLLLIDDRGEALLCDERVPGGFSLAGIEPVTGCPVSYGPSSWRNPAFRAAMPAFGPPSVIAVGTPAGTGQALADWQLTVMHEHFHQWQADLPDYYPRVQALDLSGGDQTGMWMLNYPFPYDAPAFAAAFDRASSALDKALAAEEGEAFDTALDNFLSARRAMRGTVSEAEWRYFEFQLWQEGVARWTEIALGKLHPDETVRQAAQAARMRAMARLRSPQIAADGRIAIYSYGYGEAALLEKAGAEWRKLYPGLLALGPLFHELEK